MRNGCGMLLVLAVAAGAGCSGYYTDYTAEHGLAVEERAAARGGYTTSNAMRPQAAERVRIVAPTSPGVLGDPGPPPEVSREGYPRRERRSPTDPNSAFDDRFERRTYRDDVNRLAPREPARREGVWGRDFETDR